MGVAVDSLRLQQLTNEKSELEYKIQLVIQAREGLTRAGADLMQVGTDYSPDSPVIKQLNQRQAKLKILEQKLDKQMVEYQTRLQMVTTEMESCRGRLQGNIGRAFSYG